VLFAVVMAFIENPWFLCDQSLTLTCFRFAVVYDMVPENLHKLFNNMRKSDERKERQKSVKTSDSDIANTKESSRKRKSETSVILTIYYIHIFYPCVFG
jgi:hypothetical protein